MLLRKPLLFPLPLVSIFFPCVFACLIVLNTTFNNISVVSFIGTPVYSTYKTDCHDITEILLKVALNTITQTNETSTY